MSKIAFKPKCEFDDEALLAFREINNGRGLPQVGSRPVSKHLAVVGGGQCNIDELKSFDGDVWAINGAWKWLRDKYIDASFYTIDSSENVLNFIDGVNHAVLGATVNPKVFDALSDCDIEIADVMGSIKCDMSSASTAPIIAAECGYKSVTFFGVTLSFEDETHSYGNSGPVDNFMWVTCGGKEYKTRPDMVMQAESIARMVNAFKDAGLHNSVIVKGSGFLPSLIQHGDYDVTHVSSKLDKELRHATDL